MPSIAWDDWELTSQQTDVSLFRRRLHRPRPLHTWGKCCHCVLCGRVALGSVPLCALTDFLAEMWLNAHEYGQAGATQVTRW